MKTDNEEAVTWQHRLLNDCDFLPARGERLEVFFSGDESRSQIISGPNIIGPHAGPKGYSQTFKAGAWIKNNVYFLGGYDLNGKIPDGEGTHIHFQTLGGGDSTFVIKGYEASCSSMIRNRS